MIPESHISWFSLLQLMRRLQCLITVFLIFFGFTACAWINFFQLTDGKWCFLRIFSLIAVIKINQFRLTMFQLCDNESHLKSPVTKMNITYNLMSNISSDTFDALADDRRTQMSDMKRLCHVRSAVVNNDGLW